MLTLIRLSVLALFIFANPALASCLPILSPTFRDVANCVESQEREISIQALDISTLRLEMSNLRSEIDTLRTQISTLEMQIPSTYRKSRSRPVSPKEKKIQPGTN